MVFASLVIGSDRLITWYRKRKNSGQVLVDYNNGTAETEYRDSEQSGSTSWDWTYVGPSCETRYLVILQQWTWLIVADFLFIDSFSFITFDSSPFLHTPLINGRVNEHSFITHLIPIRLLFAFRLLLYRRNFWLIYISFAFNLDER